MVGDQLVGDDLKDILKDLITSGKLEDTINKSNLSGELKCILQELTISKNDNIQSTNNNKYNNGDKAKEINLIKQKMETMKDKIDCLEKLFTESTSGLQAIIQQQSILLQNLTSQIEQIQIKQNTTDFYYKTQQPLYVNNNIFNSQVGCNNSQNQNSTFLNNSTFLTPPQNNNAFNIDLSQQREDNVDFFFGASDAYGSKLQQNGNQSPSYFKYSNIIDDSQNQQNIATDKNSYNAKF